MTITLTSQIETRLRRKAELLGSDVQHLAMSLLSDSLVDVSEEELRAEHHALVQASLTGNLSDEQDLRLREVSAELDAVDAQSPAARSMAHRVEEAGSSSTRC